MKNPEARLRAFLAVCGSMRTDDSGGQQPKYRMDTYRIMAEFEKPKVCLPCCPSLEHEACSASFHSVHWQDHISLCIAHQSAADRQFGKEGLLL